MTSVGGLGGCIFLYISALCAGLQSGSVQSKASCGALFFHPEQCAFCLPPCAKPLLHPLPGSPSILLLFNISSPISAILHLHASLFWPKRQAARSLPWGSGCNVCFHPCVGARWSPQLCSCPPLGLAPAPCLHTHTARVSPPAVASTVCVCAWRSCVTPAGGCVCFV